MRIHKKQVLIFTVIFLLVNCLAGCNSDKLTDRSIRKILKQDDEISSILDISSITIKATKDLYNTEYDKFVLLYGKTSATNDNMYFPICVNMQEKQALSIYWEAPLSIIMQEILLNGDEETNIAIFSSMAEYIKALGFDCFTSEENAIHFTNDITVNDSIIDVKTARAIMAEPLIQASGEYIRDNVEVFFEPGRAIPKYLAIKSSTMVYNWSSILPESAYGAWQAVTDRDAQRFLQAEYGPPYVMGDVWKVTEIKQGTIGAEDSVLGNFASIEQIKKTLHVDDSETNSVELAMATNTTIAKVNGRIVTKAAYVYHLEDVKQRMLSEFGTTDAENFWDDEIDGEKASEVAKKRALEEMLRVEIACIKAEEKGLTVSEEELKQIRDLVKTTDSTDKTMIDSVKETTGLSDDGLISVLTKTTLASTYAADLIESAPEALTPAEEEIATAYEQEYVHVKHILIPNSTAQQKELAESVLKKAKAGADFDSLVQEYGQDPGMESTPEGYTFTKGQMTAAFESASYALEADTISDLVETEYGWHIIKRCELPTSGPGYDEARQAITADLTQNKYNALLDSYKSEMTIEIRQNVIDGVKVN